MFLLLLLLLPGLELKICRLLVRHLAIQVLSIERCFSRLEIFLFKLCG